jgi:hypothetical protein
MLMPQTDGYRKEREDEPPRPAVTRKIHVRECGAAENLLT